MKINLNDDAYLEKFYWKYIKFPQMFSVKKIYFIGTMQDCNIYIGDAEILP